MTPYCNRRNFQDRGCFLDAEPAEVSQLNNLALVRKNFSQIMQRFIQGDYFRGAFLRHYCGFVESYFARVAAALGIVFTSRMIDQNLAHRLRGHGEEVGAVSPVRRMILAHQLEVGFIDQRGGLQCMFRTLALHVAVRAPAQILINKRRQLVERSLIPLTPGIKQPGHFMWRGWSHLNLSIRGDSKCASGRADCITLVSLVVSTEANAAL